MADTKEVLRRVLKELDEEEKSELLESLKGKKLTSDELLAAIRELPPEARKEVREALADVKEDIEEEDKDKKKTKTKIESTEDDEEEDKDKKAPKTRTRPGRKSGRAYGWWIDDDGEVVKLDIARVYSGPDEPDEVDLLPKANDDEDEEDNEDVA